MRYIIYIAIILTSTASVLAQEEDHITDALHNLSKVYYYDQLEVGASKKYNFKPGEIPKYEDATYQQRISSLASGSPFNYTYNRVVRKYIDRYTNNIKSVSTILALTKLYFPLYEKYLVQSGIPVELKYLSIVESALNPTAKSPCGAAGLWQFMYGTAKGMKLDINSYVDERYDPEKETIAACNYLKDLHDIYGDWSLAIAAYNCGPGNVNKGIKKAGKKDFWAIYDYLPKETQGYVPAFIAVSYIMTYHEEHNMVEADAKFLYDELDNITVTEKTTIEALAVKLRMAPKELRYLNPKFYVGIIPGNHDQVVVPRQKALDWIDIQKGVTPKEIVVSKKQETKVAPQATVATAPNAVQKKSVFGTKTAVGTNIEIYTSSYDQYAKNLQSSPAIILDNIGIVKLQEGAQVQLKNQKDCFINNNLISAGTVFFGTIKIVNKAPTIYIYSAQTKKGKLSVNLVADIDAGSKLAALDDGYSIYVKI